MADFKTVSHVVIATSPGKHPQSPAEQTEDPEHSRVAVQDKRRKKRRKSQNVSIELISNSPLDGMPSPHQLAAEGNLEDLKRYIESAGATIKERDERGATLLHHAVENKQTSVMQYLISSGVNLSAVDNDGNTALHIACSKGFLNAVHILLGAGVSNTILNKESDAPLHIIMRDNNTELLEAYLQYPVDILIEGYRKRTPLHVAAEKDNKEVCEVLHNVILSNEHFKKIVGFRICAPDADDLTPIHLAARSGSHRVLGFIISRCLEHGYAPKKVLSFLDEEDSTPLQAAVDGGHLQVVEVLLHHNARPDECKGKQPPPFLLASAQGKLDIMKLMVEHCGKEVVHCRDGYEQTALHRCAHAINSFEIIQYLVENGANVDAIDNEGRTPLVAAIKAGSIGGSKVLLSSGANILIKDKNGQNPLHYAVKHKRKFILSCLLEKPSSSELVTDCDNSGNSPIHMALRLSLNNMVALMVSSATQQLKNTKDVNGNNYLHLAAASGDWKALSILLDISGGHMLLNQTNNYGGTPLHLAAGKGHQRAVEILLSNGAMVHKCYSGNTPFMYACLQGHADIAKITYEAHPFQLTWTDDLGNNALHLGAKSGSPQVITLLLDIGVPVILNDSGETFFDIIISNHLSKCAMAVVDHERWQECLDVVAPDKDHPVVSLIQLMPDVAKMVLDRSQTKADVPPEAKGYWESYDFKYLRLESECAYETTSETCDSEKARLLEDDSDHMIAPTIKYKGSTVKSGQSPSYRQKKCNGHLEVLQTMVRFNRVPLLTHPVTESYLKSKWREYGRWVQLVKMAGIILQIIFLIAFTFLAPSPVAMRSAEDSSNCTDSYNCATSNTTTIEFSLASNVVRFLTIGFTTLNLFHWLVTVIRLGFPEVLNFTRNVFILIDLLSVVFTYVFTIPWTGSLNIAVWEAGAVASFTTWFSLVLTIQLFDLFGVYITMILTITRTVFQVLLICAFFIIAFAMSLYILVGNTQEFSTIGYSLFSNFAHLLGEIDYVYFIEKDVEGHLFFSALTFLFVIIIAITMAIVIQNLLIGLAVGDIEKIKENAIGEKRAIEVGFYKRIDSIIPKKLFRRLDKGKYTSFPNNKVLGLRFIWRYFWRTVKGEDPNKGDDNDDAFASVNSGGALQSEIDGINRRIDELAESQEKVITLLGQILAAQQNTKVEPVDNVTDHDSSN